MLPETPRWLISKSKVEEVLKILCKLHPTTDENEFAHREFDEINTGFCMFIPEMEHTALLDPMALLKSESSYKESRIDRLIKLKPPRRIKPSHEDASTLVIPTAQKELACWRRNTLTH